MTYGKGTQVFRRAGHISRIMYESMINVWSKYFSEKLVHSEGTQLNVSGEVLVARSTSDHSTHLSSVTWLDSGTSVLVSLQLRYDAGMRR